MSAKLLRLQTTEEGQAGFGAEQLKVVLNAFFKVRFFFQTLNQGTSFEDYSDETRCVFFLARANTAFKFEEASFRLIV